MKNLAFVSALALLLGAPAIAAAQPVGAYANLGYSHYNDDDVNADYGGVTGRLGYRFHPNFGVEGEATLGVNDDDAAELDSAIGAYGVGFLPVTPNFDLLARVGYSKINADGAGPLSGANLDDEGVGYGVGAQYTFATGWGLRGDYTRHDGDRDLNTWGVALTRSF